MRKSAQLVLALVGALVRDAQRRVNEIPRRPVTDRVRMNIGFKNRSIMGG